MAKGIDIGGNKGTPNFSTAVGQVIIYEKGRPNQYNFFSGDAQIKSPKYNKHKSVEYFPFLTGITVVMNNNSAPLLQFSIDVPYLEGMQMMSTGAFLNNNTVVLNLGYENYMAGSWVGFIAPGGVGLTIGAEGVTGTITCNITSQDRKAVIVPKGTGKTIDKWMRQITSSVDYELTYELGVRARFKTYGKRFAMPVGMDMEMSLDYLCKLVNCSWTINPKAIYAFNSNGNFVESVREITISVLEYIDDSKTGSKGKKVSVKHRVFKIRSVIDYAKRIYPIIEFSPKLAAAIFSPDVFYGTANVNKGKVDTVKTKEPKTVKKSNIKPDKGKTSQSKTTAPNGKELNKLAVKNMKDTQLRDEGVSGSKGQIPITGILNTLGIPDMRAWENIIIETEAKLINGLYQVKKVTHVYTPGEFNTTLDVFRKG